MANTPQGYGSSRENAERMDAKYDTNLEADLVNWIQLRTRRNKVAEVGKDGVIILHIFESLSFRSPEASFF